MRGRRSRNLLCDEVDVRMVEEGKEEMRDEREWRWRWRLGGQGRKGVSELRKR